MSNMRYASPKKSGKGGKGFFVALGVCLIAVGAAAFLTYQNVSQYFSPEQSASSQQPESKAESTQQAGNTVSGVKETVSSASSSEAASFILLILFRILPKKPGKNNPRGEMK